MPTPSLENNNNNNNNNNADDLAVLSDQQWCQIHHWYPIFRSHTIRTLFVELPRPTFADYLRSDGADLPAGTSTANLSCCLFVNHQNDHDDDDDDDWSSSSGDENHKDTNDNEKKKKEPSIALSSLSSSSFSFPQLDAQIDDTIAQLDGRIFPKLNWSSPQDAAWMTGTLMCQSAADVYLLLHASDFALSDVVQQQQQQQPSMPLVLALRKWVHFEPGREFRCFVRNHRLRAICERTRSGGGRRRRRTLQFPSLDESESNDDCSYNNNKNNNKNNKFVNRIQEFFDHEIVSKLSLTSVVMDVYIATKQDRVWLIDFNVWRDRTDALLFDWEELEKDDDDDDDDKGRLLFRVVDSNNSSNAPHVEGNSLGSYRVPVDVGMQEFGSFMDQCVAPSELDKEQEEEEPNNNKKETTEATGNNRTS